MKDSYSIGSIPIPGVTLGHNNSNFISTSPSDAFYTQWQPVTTCTGGCHDHCDQVIRHYQTLINHLCDVIERLINKKPGDL